MNFAARVTAERGELAARDPGGERDAIAPLPPVWAFAPPVRNVRVMDTLPGMPKPSMLSGRAEWVEDITIPDEDPPMALAPMVPDEGPAVLLGMGESHKSTIGQIVATTMATRVEIVPGWRPAVTGPVMWLDYENSRRRFARRQRILGHPEAAILYVQCLRPIWDEADELARIARREGIVAVIVDSIVPAMSGSALSSKDAEAAGKYFAAVNAIAPRSLSLAHVTKDGEGGMPYGSVFFHNLARLTWRARADEQKRVTLTNEKHTDGDRLPPMTLAFDWDDVLTVTHTTSQLTPAILGEIVGRVGTVTTHGMAAAVRAAGYVVGRSWLAMMTGRAVDEGHLTRPSRGRYEARTTTTAPLLGRAD